MPRICSFLPSATEIIYSLGLEKDLFGVTHECDYPKEATLKPKLTRSLLSLNASSASIDTSVRASLGQGKGIYEINYEVLTSAKPDIIFTQELCEVCAVPYGEIYRAAQNLTNKPEIVSLDTFTLSDILSAIKVVGEKCDKKNESRFVTEQLERRINAVTDMTHLASSNAKIENKKNLFFIEWIDPLMGGGHWMSELIDSAGAFDPFCEDGKNSKRIEWSKVVEFSPDYIVIAPCGFGVQRAIEEAKLLRQLKGWESIPAVRNQNVYVSDGNAYFSRPGPRIVDGLEILALILNPGLSSKIGKKYGREDYAKFL